jgi:hypothetical protein
LFQAKITAEIGEVISGKVTLPPNKFVLFKSLGTILLLLLFKIVVVVAPILTEICCCCVVVVVVVVVVVGVVVVVVVVVQCCCCCSVLLLLLHVHVHGCLFVCFCEFTTPLAFCVSCENLILY